MNLLPYYTEKLPIKYQRKKPFKAIAEILFIHIVQP